ncbi:MAG: hypothetical protein ACK4MM_06525 [Fervidobacterium sp.]
MGYSKKSGFSFVIVIYTIISSILISYIVLSRLFNAFTFFRFPEILLVVFSFSLGGLANLSELISVAILSVLSSFALLQFLMFIYFGKITTFHILLTAVAKSSALFGLMSMLIIISIGTIANLVLFKINGKSTKIKN